ncbi:MAG TPA: class I SAM-dependent methyltransferase [Thermoanaerobaculia bacterium]|jgi:SAM-dependent methyltransferase|nr:class I SAM-dependent methyltransferase [Thermoanaerobaculia bacterium]
MMQASDTRTPSAAPGLPTSRQAWSHHWTALGSERRFFGWLASLVRRGLLARAVRHYSSRFFRPRGLFVEAGCGTGESAARIECLDRKLVGVDFSLAALALARRQASYHSLLCADIAHLPCRDSSLAGIWNLGVMEHFTPPQVLAILGEFRRVVAPGGTVLLFWLPTFGLSRWVLGPLEWLRSRLRGRDFRFFPDEVNRLPSRRAARRELDGAGLQPIRVDFNRRDGFNHLILVARRPEA